MTKVLSHILSMESDKLLSRLPRLLSERLTLLGIPHKDLVLISSNMNYVLTDYRNVLCKVQGTRALNQGRAEKEIFFSQLIGKNIPTTQPLISEPFEVEGLSVGVWEYCHGVTKSEEELTTGDISLVLGAITSIHGVPFDENLTVTTLYDSIKSISEVALSYPNQDYFEKVLLELVDEYIVPYLSET